MDMQAHFYGLADELVRRLEGNESFTLYYVGEDSDFVRFNRSRVRQPGSVTQSELTVRLINGRRAVTRGIMLSRDPREDRARLGETISTLRAQLGFVPEDPFLLVNTKPSSSERIGANRLPAIGDAVDSILGAGAERDLVGIHAQGEVARGFASSTGQRNWFSSHSFGSDFSFYLQGDKAVKTYYGGFAWDSTAFEAKVRAATAELDVLGRASRTIKPGTYRAYLAPRALQEILGMMSWGGFGKRAHATRQTTFLKLISGEASLNPAVRLVENTAEGVDPDFTFDGFRKPDRVVLLADGRFGECLVSPRSAMEYGVETNGASGGESPSSLDLAPGKLQTKDILGKLDTGIYVNNLWYLNFSDRNAFRITGMTRFATFWVEKGKIVAPLDVMRFDESVYELLGSALEGLTTEREMLLSTDTYSQRSTDSVRLPGALVSSLRFTL